MSYVRGVIGMKADGHAFIDSILHSNWELGPALPGTNHQQALEPESSKRVEPKQRGRATENSLHPLPSHPPLPCGLFVLQPLDFLWASNEKCKVKANTISTLLQNSDTVNLNCMEIELNCIGSVISRFMFYLFIFSNYYNQMQ